MTRTLFRLAIVLSLMALSQVAQAVPTPTPTFNAGQIATATAAAVATGTARAAARGTVVAALTPTPNNADLAGYAPLTKTIRDQLDVYYGGRPGSINKLIKAGTRFAIVPATDGLSSLGLTDVVTPVIFAFTTSTGAAATKCLLEANVDYTVANGDVTPNIGHVLETWLIIYRPL